MLNERRKFPRALLKYQINVICSGEVIEGHPKDYIFHTYTDNISEGGIKVILEKQINPGSLVKLELFISDKESLPVECKGTVVWTQKANPENTKPDIFFTGIQFLDLTNPVFRKLLVDVINYYLANKSK
jgi:hypothetical protein